LRNSVGLFFVGGKDHRRHCEGFTYDPRDRSSRSGAWISGQKT
jgi:hypothetical protein